MKSRLVLLVTFTSFLVLLICSSLYADDPIEGENFIWVDLGDKDEGLLLSLAGNGGDGITEVDDQADVECKKLPFPYNGPGNNHMYFDIDDSFIFGGDNEVWIVMEYFDLGEGINCQYDSNGAGPVDGAFRGAGDGAFLELKPGNTETWQIHTWIITDGRFENRANGHDFRFSTHARGDMWVNRLWIFTFEPPDPFNPEDIGKAQAVEPGGKATTVWGALKQSL